MTCFRTWYFNDGIGGIWGIGLDDNGLITLTQNQNADNQMDFALLNDFDTNQVWKLSVLPSGQLQTDVTNGAVRGSRWIPVRDSRIVISSGMLAVVDISAPPPDPIPVVGQIYNPDTSAYLPPFTQPGGPGTATFPQQQIGEMLGLFVMPYCGHWVNNFDVFRATVSCQPAAILRCPLCSVVARIIVPADAIHDFGNEILMV